MNDFGVYYKKDDYAGFLKRVVIAIVDLIVLLIAAALSLFVTDYFVHDMNSYLKINFFIVIILSLLYLAILKRTQKGTIGYILTGVKIVNLKGEKPSIFKMVLRASLLVLGPFELVIDIMWLTSEATKQTLRDKYVGTYVVNKAAQPIGKSKLQNASLGVMGWNLLYREIKEDVLK
jgi:uncharacterized RDD family membrane protein YckC